MAKYKTKAFESHAYCATGLKEDKKYMKPVRLQSGTMDYPNCWGMYSKMHLGISRIIDQEIGLMVDFPLSIGRVEPSGFISPDVNFGYVPTVGGIRQAQVRAVPEDVMPDLSSFSLRYFLDKHGDWCAARYKVIDDRNVECELEIYNSSGQHREYYYNIGMLVDHQVLAVVLKKDLNGVWVAAKKYSEIESYIKAFACGSQQCVTDSFSFGIEKGQLAESFGCWDGDKVVYEVDVPEDYPEAIIYFRYVKYGIAPMRWCMRAAGIEKEFEFPQTCALDSGAWGKTVDFYHEWKVLPIELGNIKAGKHRFEFATVDSVNYDTSRIWLDGFFVSNTRLKTNDANTLLDSDVLTENHDRSATIIFDDKTENSARVSVNAAGQKWNVFLSNNLGFKNNDLVRADSYLDYLGRKNEDHVIPEKDFGSKTILNLQSQSVKVPPQKSIKTSFLLKLDGEVGLEKLPQYVQGCYGKKYPQILESPYADLIKYFYDTSFFNFSFPTTVSGRQTVFISPAKYFPTPFSWDAGFATLGMAGLCPEFAAAGSSFYLTPKNSEVPFIYYGSPVPTQFYSFWSLFTCEGEEKTLHDVYKSLAGMYEFYLGRDEKSNTDPARKGFLSTYSYNYSLGIDDHPIQVWGYKNNKIKDGVFPLILIAQILRSAKIMRNIAYIVEKYEDIEKFNADIEKLESVIEDQMWDRESGLYGWLYNDCGNIRRPEVCGSQGDLSGCSMLPMFAGILTHRKELMAAITDPERFWTQWGISSVDMKAPYYDPMGYWNGGIWPVMNWFIWRAMIEAGELNFARQIVIRILDTWSDFFRTEHYCGEHFSIARQHMEGVPNFTGLDTAIVDMHNAYFKRYTITLPFDAWVTSKEVDYKNDSIEFILYSPFAKKESIRIQVVMSQPNQNYLVYTGDMYIKVNSDQFGYFNFVCPVNIDRRTKIAIKCEE